MASLCRRTTAMRRLPPGKLMAGVALASHLRSECSAVGPRLTQQEIIVDLHGSPTFPGAPHRPAKVCQLRNAMGNRRKTRCPLHGRKSPPGILKYQGGVAAPRGPARGWQSPAVER